MNEEVEGLEILLPEVTIKSCRKKKCYSKILKYILDCLNAGLHKHMLLYCNKEKTEFKVFLLNKKNRNWTRKNIILFEELDDISPDKYDKNSEKYPEETRVRFKSNITKLIKGKYLKKLELDEDDKKEIERNRCLCILKLRILKPQHIDENANYPAVRKKYPRAKNGKRSCETEAGPSNKKIRISPLVLPLYDMKNFQNDGVNPLSGSDPFDVKYGIIPEASSPINSNDLSYGIISEGNNPINSDDLSYGINLEANNPIKSDLYSCNGLIEKASSPMIYENDNNMVAFNDMIDLQDIDISFWERLETTILDETLFEDDEKKVLTGSTNPLLSSTMENNKDPENTINIEDMKINFAQLDFEMLKNTIHTPGCFNKC